MIDAYAEAARIFNQQQAARQQAMEQTRKGGYRGGLQGLGQFAPQHQSLDSYREQSLKKEITFKEELQDEIDLWLKDI